MKVDLFLGGPLGIWVLDNVDPQTIGTVYTTVPAIVDRAHQLGIVQDKGEVGFSMHYPYLLKPEFINTYRVIYNIHPGLLPWGRCYYPVFWALWANEPAGCTLHVIDEGIDTGPIVAQWEVPKYEWDTGGSLHRRVSEMEKALFLTYWERIVREGVLPSTPQPAGGSFHYRREFFELKQNAHIEQLNSKDLLRLIMALSHDDYTGLEVERHNIKAL